MSGSCVKCSPSGVSIRREPLRWVSTRQSPSAPWHMPAWVCLGEELGEDRVDLAGGQQGSAVAQAG
jgi:hypothetical protein